MEKENFQNRMIHGVRQVQKVMGKSIILEYTKVGSTSKIKEMFVGTFEKLSDNDLKEQTTYNKDSMIFKILCVDLIDKLKTTKVKNLNSTIYCNNIKYNVVSEEITSDECLLKLYCNTV